jgi:MFS transporter, FSR family, fosmidomycin resistance protein
MHRRSLFYLTVQKRAQQGSSPHHTRLPCSSEVTTRQKRVVRGAPGVAVDSVESLPVKLNRPILAVLSYGHLATDLSQGAIPALLPVFKALFHLSYAGVGFIVLMANVSSSIIQPAFGVLSDRLRLRWMMPLGALLAGVGMTLAVFSPHYGVMVSLILVSGLGVAAFHPEGYRFAGLAAGERRATGMSYFSVGGNIGYGLGPAVATLALSLAGVYSMVYLIAFSVPAAILLWVMVGPGQRERLEAGWATPASALSGATAGPPAREGSTWILILLIVFVVLRSWVSVGTASFIPLYYTGIRHFEPWYGGTIVSLFLGAGAVGTLFGGIAADRFGRRALLIVSMAILPPLLLMIPRVSGVWTMTAAAIAGMAAVSTFAVVMVMAQDLMPQRIGMISGLIIGFAVGMGGIGVTLLGAIADRWGLQAAMDLTALLPIGALAIALALPSDRLIRASAGQPPQKEPLAAGETLEYR